MKIISAVELKAKFDNSENFQLIDIREEYELEIACIGGDHIPMGEVRNNLDKIRKDIPVIIHCRGGKRSGNMVVFLSDNGYDNLYSLHGGINAWAEQIDTAMNVY